MELRPVLAWLTAFRPGVVTVGAHGLSSAVIAERTVKDRPARDAIAARVLEMESSFEQLEEQAAVKREMRDDRVVLFSTWMPWDETLTYTYQARATTAGTFRVLPLQSYAMYDPEVMGRTGSMEITIH